MNRFVFKIILLSVCLVGTMQLPLLAQDSRIPDMPIPVVGMCSARIGSKVYFIGGAQNLQGKGLENLTGTSTVQAFNFKTMSWDTNIAPLETPRIFACAVSLEDSIFVMGGVDSLGEVLNSVEVYDPSTNSWHYDAPMLLARKGAAATVFDDHIMVFGGGDGQAGPTRQVEAYSVDAGVWHSTIDMVLGRAFHKVVRVEDAIYIIGGIGGSVGPLSLIERYVPTVGTTQIDLSLNRPRLLFGTVEAGDSVYVISGQGGSGNADSHVELLSLGTEGAERDTVLGNILDTARIGFVAAVGEDGKVYLFGGISPAYKSGQVAVPTVGSLSQVTYATYVRGAVPGMFRLDQNYPNPFNPTTVIHFEIAPPGSDISLDVYNVLGQRVRTLVSGYFHPGSYDVSFNGANLPSGAYIYRLQTSNGSSYRKMVLIK